MCWRRQRRSLGLSRFQIRFKTTSAKSPTMSYSFRSFKQWQLAALCISTTVVGYIAGRWMPSQEESATPKASFDFEEIRAQLQKTFDFRPDLAPTMLRTVFVLAARRAKVASMNIAESCSTGNGLTDVINVLQFQVMAQKISTEDLAALAAIEAIRFLKGPADKIVYRFGREDVVRQQDAQKSEDEGNRSLADMFKVINNKYTDAEIVALMACHGVGEYHPDVSGVDDAPARTLANYTLSNNYFRTLLQYEDQYALLDLPRTSSNKNLDSLPKIMKVFAKTGSKKKSLIITETEFNALLKAPTQRKYVEAFAKDHQLWEKNFVSGFQKLIESNFSRGLNEYSSSKPTNLSSTT